MDEPALVVLGSLLSGRTGRLYKSLVLDQKIANSVAAGQNGMKWEGYFMLSGVAKPGSTPEVVEQALYKEIEKLQKEKVSERELQKIKNQFAADNFRRLDSRYLLMLQILHGRQQSRLAELQRRSQENRRCDGRRYSASGQPLFQT